MAIESNYYSARKIDGDLLNNYLRGKRLLTAVTDDMTVCTNAEIISVGKHGTDEIWLTVEGIGTLYFERARLSVES